MKGQERVQEEMQRAERTYGRQGRSAQAYIRDGRRNSVVSGTDDSTASEWECQTIISRGEWMHE